MSLYVSMIFNTRCNRCYVYVHLIDSSQTENSLTIYKMLFPALCLPLTATNCRYHNTTLIFSEAKAILVQRNEAKRKSRSIHRSVVGRVLPGDGEQSRDTPFAFSYDVSRIIGSDVGHGTAKCRSRRRYNGKKRSCLLLLREANG